MRRADIAVLLAVLMLVATAANADCFYWRCQESATTATCSMFFCNGLGCDGAWWAINCTTICDGFGGGGGCYCAVQGWCYDI